MKPLQPERLDEAGKMTAERPDCVIVVSGIVGEAVTELVDGQDPIVPAEHAEVAIPGFDGRGPHRVAVVAAGDEKDRLARPMVEVAGPYTLDINPAGGYAPPPLVFVSSPPEPADESVLHNAFGSKPRRRDHWPPRTSLAVLMITGSNTEPSMNFCSASPAIGSYSIPVLLTSSRNLASRTTASKPARSWASCSFGT